MNERDIMNLISKTFKCQKGVSIFELLMGIAILGLVMSGIFTVLSGSLKAQQFNFDAAANTQDQLQILNSIGAELKNATSIDSPVPGTTSSTILYQKSGDINNRAISLGKGSNANTVIFTDDKGKITNNYGINRTQRLEFKRDSSLDQKITITLTMRNSAKVDAPSNTISTIVYTLN